MMFPLETVVDVAHVYWVDTAGKTINRIDKLGGVPMAVATDQLSPGALAVDEHGVYWSESSRFTLKSAPLAGGLVTELVPKAKGSVFGMVSDGTNLYFVAGGVNTMPRTGGAVVQLVAAKPTSSISGAFKLYDDHLYWLETNRAVTPVVSTLMRLALPSGSPVALASGPWTDVADIAVDATRIYWTAAKVVYSAAPDGSDVTTEVEELYSTHAIEIDADYVYYTTGGRMMKKARAGGEPVVIADNVTSPDKLAIDEASLYWTDCRLGGAVWRRTPK